MVGKSEVYNTGNVTHLIIEAWILVIYLTIINKQHDFHHKNKSVIRRIFGYKTIANGIGRY